MMMSMIGRFTLKLGIWPCLMLLADWCYDTLGILRCSRGGITSTLAQTTRITLYCPSFHQEKRPLREIDAIRVTKKSVATRQRKQGR